MEKRNYKEDLCKNIIGEVTYCKDFGEEDCLLTCNYAIYNIKKLKELEKEDETYNKRNDFEDRIQAK